MTTRTATDVKDSNDRFANAQTHSLLQRIESFDGVAIRARPTAPRRAQTLRELAQATSRHAPATSRHAPPTSRHAPAT